MTDLSDRQAASKRQGDTFEATVKNLLEIEGWKILDQNWRHPACAVEIDIVAIDPDGETWWIECKGSWESRTGNGLERTDTAKKAIANAAIIRTEPPGERCRYMLIASHFPRFGSSGETWMKRAASAYFDRFRIVRLDDVSYDDVPLQDEEPQDLDGDPV